MEYNFVWTDERAKLLIDTYLSYLEHDANKFDSRERCLEKLKTVFNEVPADINPADDIINMYSEKRATADDITSKLNEFATTYFNKYQDEIKYGMLKKILKEKWSQFKLLVQHEKFEYYRPLNAPPLARCATRLKGRSSNSSSTRFYWTDDLLQHLVLSYHLVLRSINVGTVKPKRTDCLNHLKRLLGGGVSFDMLESKLDAIFRNEILQHVPRLYFRKRLGKEICIIYEEILVDAHRDVYQKETRTSSKSLSHKTSSSIRSPYMLAAAKKRVETDRLVEAVRKLGFEGPDFAPAMCELSSDSLQRMFWACQGDERKTYVEQCIKNQKWRSSQGL